MEAAQIDRNGRSAIGWQLDPDCDDLVDPDDFTPGSLPDDRWLALVSSTESRTSIDDLLAALDGSSGSQAGHEAFESSTTDQIAGLLLDGASGPAVADVIGLLDERRLGGQCLIGAILACDRLASWAAARQQEFTAALARPGVGIPIEQALEASMYVAGSRELSVSPTHPLQPEWDDDAGCYSAATVIGDPDWDAAIAVQSARLVAPHLAVALHLSPLTARQRIDDALQMVDHFPRLLGAQRTGSIDRIRARIVAEGTECLDAEKRAGVLDRVLPGAGSMAPGRLRAAVDRAVISADPDAAKNRAEQARHDRQVRLQKLSDDMSRLAADLPADKAHLAFGVIDRIACSLTGEAAAGRDINELRADVLTDIFDQLAATGLVDLTGIGECDGAIGSDGTTDASDDPVRSSRCCAVGDPGHTTERDRPEPCEQTHHTAVPGDPSGQKPTQAAAYGEQRDTTQHTSATACEPGSTSGSVVNEEHSTDSDSGITTPRATASTRSEPTADCAAGAADHEPAPSPSGEPSPRTSRHKRARGRAQRTFRGSLCLNVTIAASTLAGFDDQPGELAGHGAITANLARALAESADSVRALVFQPGCNLPWCSSDPLGPARGYPGSDCPSSGSFVMCPPGSGDSNRAAIIDEPRAQFARCAHSGCAGSRYCGTSLDYGRAVYLPPTAVADAIVSRDQRCRFPGCGMPAHRCDIDHRVPFDSSSPGGGSTCPCNLQSLCRSHHRCKTFTDWTIAAHPDGSLRWTSALGPSAVDRPELPPLGSPWPVEPWPVEPDRRGVARVIGRDGAAGDRVRSGGPAPADHPSHSAKVAAPHSGTGANADASTSSAPGDDPPF